MMFISKDFYRIFVLKSKVLLIVYVEGVTSNPNPNTIVRAIATPPVIQLASRSSQPVNKYTYSHITFPTHPRSLF